MAPVKRGVFYMLGQLLLAIGILASLFLLLLYFLAYGVPLHDFRLWRLEKSFEATAHLYHPSESIFLERKIYLGGPSEHGSGVCDVYVGELRSAPIAKEDVQRAYKGRSTKSGVPLAVLFPDENWTMESPLGDWWSEWHGSPILALGTPYFVFATRRYSFLGDMRCDD